MEGKEIRVQSIKLNRFTTHSFGFWQHSSMRRVFRANDLVVASFGYAEAYPTASDPANSANDTRFPEI
jgi:hypothetical protein